MSRSRVSSDVPLRRQPDSKILHAWTAVSCRLSVQGAFYLAFTRP
jgi:hypothetical protein